MMSAGEPATLAMMPLIAPAVIKLDVTVTQGGLGWQLVNTLDIVYEEAERTGATILAEGIENRTHLNVARSLGAVLGQGHYLGVPAAPTDQMRRPARRIEIGAQTPPAVSTPIGALSDHLIGRSGTDLLGLLCRRIESSVEHAPVPALLISLLPEPGMFGEEERTRFARLADRGATTAILGPGIRAEPGSNIRGTGLRHEEPIEGEWAMVALNPAATGAMLARVARDGIGYEFGVTHETPRVLAAARCLFRRLGAPYSTVDAGANDRMTVPCLRNSRNALLSRSSSRGQASEAQAGSPTLENRVAFVYGAAPSRGRLLPRRNLPGPSCLAFGGLVTRPREPVLTDRVKDLRSAIDRPRLSPGQVRRLSPATSMGPP